MTIFRWLGESATCHADLKKRLLLVLGAIVTLNVGAWLWAFTMLRDNVAALGIAALVYGLGLRHAVDVDHIAAIDNITRKLMQENKKPVAVGFFFALGHSLIVLIVTAVVAAVRGSLERIDQFKNIGGIVSTAVSALFLFAVAVMNITIFVSVCRSFRRLRRDGTIAADDLNVLLENRGLLARIIRPLFRLVTKSWHMFPLGFLFGLGFDTATEVAVFGISVSEVAQGSSLASVLVFPTLFAAGMSLVDTADGIVMVGVYDWALINPVRKLYYNMAITLTSIVVALLIGGVEAIGLIGSKFELHGLIWNAAAAVNENLNKLGLVFVATFLIVWFASFTAHRLRAERQSPSINS